MLTLFFFQNSQSQNTSVYSINTVESWTERVIGGGIWNPVLLCQLLFLLFISTPTMACAASNILGGGLLLFFATGANVGSTCMTNMHIINPRHIIGVLRPVDSSTAATTTLTINTTTTSNDDNGNEKRICPHGQYWENRKGCRRYVISY